MQVGELLDQCRDMEIDIGLGGRSLRIESRNGGLTPEMRERLSANKAGLRNLLEAEGEYERLYAELCQLWEDGDEAQADALIQGSYGDARERYMVVLRVDEMPA